MAWWGAAFGCLRKPCKYRSFGNMCPNAAQAHTCARCSSARRSSSSDRFSGGTPMGVKPPDASLYGASWARNLSVLLPSGTGNSFWTCCHDWRLAGEASCRATAAFRSNRSRSSLAGQPPGLVWLGEADGPQLKLLPKDRRGAEELAPSPVRWPVAASAGLFDVVGGRKSAEVETVGGSLPRGLFGPAAASGCWGCADAMPPPARAGVGAVKASVWLRC